MVCGGERGAAHWASRSTKSVSSASALISSSIDGLNLWYKILNRVASLSEVNTDKID